MYKPGATSQTIQYLFIPNASGGVSLFFILHVSVGHDSAVLELENKGISLSVLPMVRLMIAHWENYCISLSVFSVAQV